MSPGFENLERTMRDLISSPTLTPAMGVAQLGPFTPSTFAPWQGAAGTAGAGQQTARPGSRGGAMTGSPVRMGGGGRGGAFPARGSGNGAAPGAQGAASMPRRRASSAISQDDAETPSAALSYAVVASGGSGAGGGLVTPGRPGLLPNSRSPNSFIIQRPGSTGHSSPDPPYSARSAMNAGGGPTQQHATSGRGGAWTPQGRGEGAVGAASSSFEPTTPTRPPPASVALHPPHQGMAAPRPLKGKPAGQLEGTSPSSVTLGSQQGQSVGRGKGSVGGQTPPGAGAGGKGGGGSPLQAHEGAHSPTHPSSSQAFRPSSTSYSRTGLHAAGGRVGIGGMGAGGTTVMLSPPRVPSSPQAGGGEGGVGPGGSSSAPSVAVQASPAGRLLTTIAEHPQGGQHPASPQRGAGSSSTLYSPPPSRRPLGATGGTGSGAQSFMSPATSFELSQTPTDYRKAELRAAYGAGPGKAQQTFAMQPLLSAASEGGEDFDEEGSLPPGDDEEGQAAPVQPAFRGQPAQVHGADRQAAAPPMYYLMPGPAGHGGLQAYGTGGQQQQQAVAQAQALAYYHQQAASQLATHQALLMGAQAQHAAMQAHAQRASAAQAQAQAQAQQAEHQQQQQQDEAQLQARAVYIQSLQQQLEDSLKQVMFLQNSLAQAQGGAQSPLVAMALASSPVPMFAGAAYDSRQVVASPDVYQLANGSGGPYGAEGDTAEGGLAWQGIPQAGASSRPGSAPSMHRDTGSSRGAPSRPLSEHLVHAEEFVPGKFAAVGGVDTGGPRSIAASAPSTPARPAPAPAAQTNQAGKRNAGKAGSKAASVPNSPSRAPAEGRPSHQPATTAASSSGNEGTGAPLKAAGPALPRPQGKKQVEQRQNGKAAESKSVVSGGVRIAQEEQPGQPAGTRTGASMPPATIPALVAVQELHAAGKVTEAWERLAQLLCARPEEDVHSSSALLADPTAWQLLCLWWPRDESKALPLQLQAVEQGILRHVPSSAAEQPLLSLLSTAWDCADWGVIRSLATTLLGSSPEAQAKDDRTRAGKNGPLGQYAKVTERLVQLLAIQGYLSPSIVSFDSSSGAGARPVASSQQAGAYVRLAIQHLSTVPAAAAAAGAQQAAERFSWLLRLDPTTGESLMLHPSCLELVTVSDALSLSWVGANATTSAAGSAARALPVLRTKQGYLPSHPPLPLPPPLYTWIARVFGPAASKHNAEALFTYLSRWLRLSGGGWPDGTGLNFLDTCSALARALCLAYPAVPGVWLEDVRMADARALRRAREASAQVVSEVTAACGTLAGALVQGPLQSVWGTHGATVHHWVALPVDLRLYLGLSAASSASAAAPHAATEADIKEASGRAIAALRKLASLLCMRSDAGAGIPSPLLLDSQPVFSAFEVSLAVTAGGRAQGGSTSTAAGGAGEEEQQKDQKVNERRGESRVRSELVPFLMRYCLYSSEWGQWVLQLLALMTLAGAIAGGAAQEESGDGSVPALLHDLQRAYIACIQHGCHAAEQALAQLSIGESLCDGSQAQVWRIRAQEARCRVQMQALQQGAASWTALREQVHSAVASLPMAAASLSSSAMSDAFIRQAAVPAGLTPRPFRDMLAPTLTPPNPSLRVFTLLEAARYEEGLGVAGVGEVGVPSPPHEESAGSGSGSGSGSRGGVHNSHMRLYAQAVDCLTLPATGADGKSGGVRSGRAASLDWKTWIASMQAHARAGNAAQAVQLCDTVLASMPDNGKLLAAAAQVQLHSPAALLSLPASAASAAVPVAVSVVETRAAVPPALADSVALMAHYANFLHKAAAAAPKSGEVHVERARLHLHPLSALLLRSEGSGSCVFNPAAARECLATANKYTGQFGDEYVEMARVEALQAVVAVMQEERGKTESHGAGGVRWWHVSPALLSNLSTRLETLGADPSLTPFEAHGVTFDPNYGTAWLSCCPWPVVPGHSARPVDMMCHARRCAFAAILGAPHVLAVYALAAAAALLCPAPGEDAREYSDVISALSEAVEACCAAGSSPASAEGAVCVRDLSPCSRFATALPEVTQLMFGRSRPLSAYSTRQKMLVLYGGDPLFS